MSNTTTAKVLSTLCLFGHNGGRLGVAEMMQRLGVSSATAYRYLAELEDAGLVSRFAIGEYVLGPEIVALDRAAREHDPYVSAAQPVMTALARTTGASVILGRPYGNKLVYVLDVLGSLGPPGLANMRGRSESLQYGITLRTVPTDRPDAHSVGASVPEPSDQGETLHSTLTPQARNLRGRKVHCWEGEGDAVVWTTAIRRGKQVIGSLGAAFQRAAPMPDPASMVDQMWRAALRIEGRLRTPRPI